MSNFEVSKSEKYTTIKSLRDKLGGVISPELKAVFVQQNAQGEENMILDLSDTRYCDSSGLSAILVGNRLCKNSGGVLVICGLQPMVSKLISISQLDNILIITPTLDEAQQYILMEAVERDVEDEN